MKTLFDHLKAHAKKRPDHTALIEEKRRISYGQLNDRALSVAAAAQNLGIEKGHKVLLMVPLGIDFFVLFMALMRLGAIVVLIDPAQPTKVISQCVENVKPDVFIGIKKAHLLRFLPAVRAIPKAITTDGPTWFADSIDLNAESIQSDNFAQPAPDDAGLMTFTSGSTGRPKTIVRSHDFLIKQHQAVQATLKPRPDDVELSTLPVFILSNLGAGITSVIPLKDYSQPHKMQAASMVAYAEAHGVNRLLAAPAFLARLCETGQTLTGVRRIFTGGGPVFPNLLAKLSTLCPQAEVTMVYGSSEAEPIAHCAAHEMSEADLSLIRSGGGLLAGHWHAGLGLKIITPEAQIHGPLDQLAFVNIEMPNGTVGEIVVSGDHVVKSYLNPLEAAQTKFRVNDTLWHRTGDAGFIDEQNRLWLMGRVSARIVSSSAILYPFALEAAIMCDAHVTRAAALGQGGEVIMAIETTRPLDILALNHLKATHPAINRVVVVESIPMDKRHHSKVLYESLRKQLGL